MRRALILDSKGRDVITVNESYDTINFIISSNKGNPALEFQLNSKELLKDLHKFIGNVIQNNIAVEKIKNDLTDLRMSDIKSENKETKEKIDQLQVKLKEITKK